MKVVNEHHSDLCFTVTEISYLVACSFGDLLEPACDDICGTQFLGCTCVSLSQNRGKEAMRFLILCGIQSLDWPNNQFSRKIISLVDTIVKLMTMISQTGVDLVTNFFSNFGFHCLCS